MRLYTVPMLPPEEIIDRSLLSEVQYHKLRRYLVQQEGYTPHEAVHSIRRLRKMTPKLIHEFLLWFRSGMLPEAPLYGLRIGELMESRELGPVAAFLALDFLAKEPEAARWQLTHAQSGFTVTPEDKDWIRQQAKINGWILHEKKDDTQEDTSDLVDPLPASTTED